MRRLAVAAVVALGSLSVGCSTGPWDAPAGSYVVEMEDIQVSWTGCPIDQSTGEPTNPNCNVEQPSPPVVLPVTAVVLGPDDLPMNNVRVWISTGFKEIYVLPQEVIEAVAIPETDNWTSLTEDGEVWAEFTGSWEGDYRPNYYETWTDGNGLAKFWLWIQKMPLDQGGQARASSFRVDIGVHALEVKLQSGG